MRSFGHFLLERNDFSHNDKSPANSSDSATDESTSRLDAIYSLYNLEQIIEVRYV